MLESLGNEIVQRAFYAWTMYAKRAKRGVLTLALKRAEGLRKTTIARWTMQTRKALQSKKIVWRKLVQLSRKLQLEALNQWRVIVFNMSTVEEKKKSVDEVNQRAEALQLYISQIQGHLFKAERQVGNQIMRRNKYSDPDSEKSDLILCS